MKYYWGDINIIFILEFQNYSDKTNGGTMKKVVFIFFMFFFVILQAQEREVFTLFESNWINTVNSYGLFETKISQIDDGWGALIGAKGGIMVNDTFTLCLAGYIYYPQPTDLNCLSTYHKGYKYNELRGGYGGLVFEYIYASANLVHFSGNVLVGMGGLKITHDAKYPYYYYYHNHPLRAFFITEPGINTNLNLTRNFKATLGVSYRITPNTSLKYYDREFATSSVFDGLSINIGFIVYDIF